MMEFDVVKKMESRAPGKVILMGEHAVVHGGAAVAASLGLYTHACILVDGRIHGKEEFLAINFPQLEVHLKWPLATLRSAFEWPVLDEDAAVHSCSNELHNQLESFVATQLTPQFHGGAVAGIMAFLYLYASIYGLRPSTVTVTSELPVGAGLGSSAAFCVSLSAALLALAGKLKYSPSGKWLDVDTSCLKLVNEWAFEGEKIIHGRPSGIDNTVSTFGSIVKFKQAKLTPLHDAMPLRMLLTNTRVGRNTKALVAGVGDRAKKFPQAMAAIFSAIDAIAEEAVSILQLGEADDSGYTREVDGDGEQVADSQGPKSNAEVRLEELVEMNQGLLKSIGVSHTTIETICQVTSKLGLYSKLTGAGGGGCVLTLLPSDTSAASVEQVKSELEGAGFDCFEAAIGGKGVQVAGEILTNSKDVILERTCAVNVLDGSEHC